MKLFTTKAIWIGAILSLCGMLSYQVGQAGERRSAQARYEFMRQHPCPATGAKRGACHGYVIDHIIPLDCHGADDPSNMQWQTIAEGKAKDKWERNGDDCRHRTHGQMPPLGINLSE
ncbi:MAG: HNH endonuclease signature motif containing protein [Candidatus Symbiobacter sp.]|nr:HNH endonuclease signature motif containing protein [Candidatus Symbiobacter sp.]